MMIIDNENKNYAAVKNWSNEVLRANDGFELQSNLNWPKDCCSMVNNQNEHRCFQARMKEK